LKVTTGTAGAAAATGSGAAGGGGATGGAGAGAGTTGSLPVGVVERPPAGDPAGDAPVALPRAPGFAPAVATPCGPVDGWPAVAADGVGGAGVPGNGVPGAGDVDPAAGVVAELSGAVTGGAALSVAAGGAAGGASTLAVVATGAGVRLPRKAANARRATPTATTTASPASAMR